MDIVTVPAVVLESLGDATGGGVLADFHFDQPVRHFQESEQIVPEVSLLLDRSHHRLVDSTLAKTHVTATGNGWGSDWCKSRT